MSESNDFRKINFLKHFIPLNTLSESMLAVLMTHVEIFNASPEKEIMRQGDTNPYHIYLLRGTVNLRLDGAVMETLEATSPEARFPVAHAIPRKYGIFAVTPVHFMRIDSRAISDLQNQADSAKVAAVQLGEVDEDSDESDWMAQLLHLPAFQLISPANLQKLIRLMEPIEMQEGQEVIKQGERGDYFYLINTGHCKVVKDMEDGHAPVELARLGPGKSFGEDALLSDGIRNASILMTSRGTLFRLSKEHFTSLIKDPLSKVIDYPEAEALIAERGVWLDVRGREAFEKHHFEGAFNFPFDQIRSNLEMLDESRIYIIVCRTGDLSHAAAYLMSGLGLDIRILKGGIEAAPLPQEAVAGEGSPDHYAGDSILYSEESELASDLLASDVLMDKYLRLRSKTKKLTQYVKVLQEEKAMLEKKRLSQIDALRQALNSARQELDSLKNG